MTEIEKRLPGRPRKDGLPPGSAMRPDMRPELTASATDAAARAAEIRQHLGNLDEGTDDFHVDLDAIPDGWTYEWKRHTVAGQEDPSYRVALARMGWQAVPASRHPEMMPSDYKGDAIMRKGMMLMERPAEITEEMRLIERKKAGDQVRVKEQQLNQAAAGQFDRTNKGAPLAKVKKGYEPMPIPEDV